MGDSGISNLNDGFQREQSGSLNGTQPKKRLLLNAFDMNGIGHIRYQIRQSQYDLVSLTLT